MFDDAHWALFDAQVETINRRGWLVSACYQTSKERWVVCLRKNGSQSIAYGNGLTASEALHKAIRMLPRERVRLTR